MAGVLTLSLVMGPMPTASLAAEGGTGSLLVPIEGEATLDMRKIPAGTFLMGAEEAADVPEDADHISWDEGPVHQVTISEDFYLASTEVTNELFELYYPVHEQVRGTFGYDNMPNDLIGTPVDPENPDLGLYKGFSAGDDEAAVFLSWEEAVAFCGWLNEYYLPQDLKAQGYSFRLPTEAEWEYACRAGSTTAYWYGDQFNTEEGNNQYTPESERLAFYPDPSRKQAARFDALTVGTGRATPYGLYNMHGNVEEWCLDWYGPYAAGAQTDPVGRESGDSKVTRGAATPPWRAISPPPTAAPPSPRTGTGSSASGWPWARTWTWARPCPGWTAPWPISRT